MACPQQANIAAKRNKKVTKYRQLLFELRDRGPGYDIKIVPELLALLMEV